MDEAEVIGVRDGDAAEKTDHVPRLPGIVPSGNRDTVPLLFSLLGSMSE